MMTSKEVEPQHERERNPLGDKQTALAPKKVLKIITVTVNFSNFLQNC